MTRLSVNINKIATIRNARGGNMPDVEKAARDCEDFGAQGITVHPRPDEKVAKQACALTDTEVWFVGKNFAPFAPNFPHFDDVAAVKAHLQQHPQTGRLILIKGSNGTRLFELPEWL